MTNQEILDLIIKDLKDGYSIEERKDKIEYCRRRRSDFEVFVLGDKPYSSLYERIIKCQYTLDQEEISRFIYNNEDIDPTLFINLFNQYNKDKCYNYIRLCCKSDNFLRKLTPEQLLSLYKDNSNIIAIRIVKDILDKSQKQSVVEKLITEKNKKSKELYIKEIFYLDEIISMNEHTAGNLLGSSEFAQLTDEKKDEIIDIFINSFRLKKDGPDLNYYNNGNEYEYATGLYSDNYELEIRAILTRVIENDQLSSDQFYRIWQKLPNSTKFMLLTIPKTIDKLSEEQVSEVITYKKGFGHDTGNELQKAFDAITILCNDQLERLSEDSFNILHSYTNSNNLKIYISLNVWNKNNPEKNEEIRTKILSSELKQPSDYIIEKITEEYYFDDVMKVIDEQYSIFNTKQKNTLLKKCFPHFDDETIANIIIDMNSGISIYDNAVVIAYLKANEQVLFTYKNGDKTAEYTMSGEELNKLLPVLDNDGYNQNSTRKLAILTKRFFKGIYTPLQNSGWEDMVRVINIDENNSFAILLDDSKNQVHFVRANIDDDTINIRFYSSLQEDNSYVNPIWSYQNADFEKLDSDHLMDIFVKTPTQREKKEITIKNGILAKSLLQRIYDNSKGANYESTNLEGLDGMDIDSNFIRILKKQI